MTNSLVVKHLHTNPLKTLETLKLICWSRWKKTFEDHLIHEFAKIDNLVKDEVYGDLEGQNCKLFNLTIKFHCIQCALHINVRP